MKKRANEELIITGLGVISAIGQGKAEFASALMEGRHAFDVMRRPGRQKETSFLGAEIASLIFPENLSQRALRTASLSAQVALVTLHEAWREANLDDVDPTRIGLIVGGSNFQQRELVYTQEAYADRLEFLRPTYGLTFMDTDLCGLCTEQFGIRGFAYTVGGASASGHMAIIQALEAVEAGRADVCIAIGALMDISYLECQGLRALGAMGSDRYASEPARASRPFDKDRDGFIFGECCAAVVIEKANVAGRGHVKPYAAISGWAVVMDGNRGPEPSYEGEARVINDALRNANLTSAEVDYVNPHGTGSVIGDETELKAIASCRLSHAYINATKSVIGHGLSAAGAVEIVVTLLQMKASRLHPTRNLEHPVEPGFNWVTQRSVAHAMKNALNLSFGFGGINTAVCLRKLETANGERANGSSRH
jgi:malonyl-ACP decarboxylase